MKKKQRNGAFLPLFRYVSIKTLTLIRRFASSIFSLLAALKAGRKNGKRYKHVHFKKVLHELFQMLNYITNLKFNAIN